MADCSMIRPVRSIEPSMRTRRPCRIQSATKSVAPNLGACRSVRISALRPQCSLIRSRIMGPWQRCYISGITGLARELLADVDEGPAVEREGDAGDEIGLVGGEEQRGIRDVPGGAHAGAERHPCV